MYFDTHAHYDAEQFNADRDALLASMPAEGVDYIIDPGCDAASSRAAIALAEKYPFVYAAVGWQPEEWESWTYESEALVRSLAAHPKCVAIGEIGLDYYWDKEHKEIQYEMFVTQLELALELDMPVIIHDREAHEDCLNITGRYPALRGVFHCYSGSVEMARDLVGIGIYIGLGGAVTFKNARRPIEVAAWVPKDRLLIETDAPYMTPVPFRGKRNTSALISYTAEKIAQVRGVTSEQVLRMTKMNAERLFGVVCPV